MTYNEWLSSLNDNDYAWYEFFYNHDMHRAYELECGDKR